MGRRTTAKQLYDVLSNDLLKVTKAEIHHKSSEHVDNLGGDTLKGSLDLLSQTIFAGMVDWHFEKDPKARGGYIFDSGRLNPFSEDVIIVHLRVNDGVTIEDIERLLKFVEE